MEPGSPLRVLVIGPDPARLSLAARRLEALGFDCSTALGSSESLRGAALSEHDVVVALEVGGSWQPVRALLERDTATLPVAASLDHGLTGPPVLVIADGVSPRERADALHSQSSGVWDWVDADVPDREILARLRRLSAIRRMSVRVEELSRRCAGLETVDRLTGLPNHSVFQEVLTREFRRAERYGSPLSLVLLDIDRFRSLNESYGHHWGDRLLQQVARDLRSMVREVDLAARYGGEEFALLLPETGAEPALKVASRARTLVETTMDRESATLSSPSDPQPSRVTASLGVATFPEQGASTKGLLLSAAESALRRAKDEGRNRVTAHRQDAASPAPGRTIQGSGWSG